MSDRGVLSEVAEHWPFLRSQLKEESESSKRDVQRNVCSRELRDELDGELDRSLIKSPIESDWKNPIGRAPYEEPKRWSPKGRTRPNVVKRVEQGHHLITHLENKFKPFRIFRTRTNSATGEPPLLISLYHSLLSKFIS